MYVSFGVCVGARVCVCVCLCECVYVFLSGSAYVLYRVLKNNGDRLRHVK